MSRALKKPARKARIHGSLLERARGAWSTGDFSDAALLLDRLLATDSDHAEGLHLRGVVALGAGQPRIAVEFLLRVTQLCPLNDDFGCDLGTALHATQRRSDAVQAYRTVLSRNPSHQSALFNLGNVLREQMRLSEALQCYTRLLELAPEYPAWNNIGLALLDMTHVAEARNCFQQALRVNAGDVQALTNLGFVQQETGHLIEARCTLERALDVAPDHPDVHLNLGNVLLSLGQTVAGIDHLRRAVELAPGHSAAHSALICALDYDVRTSTQGQQHARRAWYDACIRPHATVPIDHYRAPDPERKLRVGYVSADFRVTSAAMAFTPMLCSYDRNQYEVFCYSNNISEDALTATLREAVMQFRVIAGMSDGEAAALMDADRIDILIDLSGHLRGHRLGIFAYRPAPLQGTAWGYANGTGMLEIDFIFCDEVFLSAEDAMHFSEMAVNLPSVIPYQALDALPPVAPSPAASTGAITFGCFSRLQKITDASVELFARALTAVPTATLVLKAAQQIEDSGVKELLAKFSVRGVDPGRVRFLRRGSWREHMESFAEIDIQFDPYPHGGGVSLLDGVAMGVPTLTLAGATPAARLGAALIGQLGLGADWVATSTDDFTAKARRLAGDISALRELRAKLRQRLMQTPIGNTTDYVQHVEARYRHLWRERSASLRTERDVRLSQARTAIEQKKSAACMLLLQSLLDADARDPTVLHYAGLAAFQANALDEAASYLNRAVKIVPQFVDAWVDLGIVHSSAEHIDEAIEALRTAAAIQPDHFLAQSNLGIAFLNAGLLDEAMSALAAAHRIDANSAGVLSNMGVVHERKGNWVEAEKYFLQSVQCDVHFALGQVNLGRAALQRKQLPQAVECFEKALALAPRLHWLRYELALGYTALGMSERLAPLLGAGKAPTSIAECLDRITQSVMRDERISAGDRTSLSADLMPIAGRLMENNHRGKITLLQGALRINASNLHAHLRLGIAHHHDGDYLAAAAAWQAGLRERDRLAQEAGLLDFPHRILDSSWTLAVGHLQLLDSYVKSMLLGLRPQRELWLLRVPRQPIPNRSYFDYWRGHVHEIEPTSDEQSNERDIAHLIGLRPAQLPLIADHFFADRIPGVHELWHMQFAAKIQRQWEEEQRSPLLQLTADDRLFGEQILRQLGVPANAWYVCLHVREEGFWWKWDRYHASIRNAKIESYQSAIDEIVARGGWVIRMGDNSMQPLPAKPHVIDYPHTVYKSERMDVFLTGSCRLFIGVNSGISLLPPTFGVPCLLTNFVPISIPFPYGSDRMLPKRFRSKRDGRVLGFEDMFACGAAHFYSENHLPDWLEVIDNSEEEIAEGVSEMLDGLEGRLTDEETAEFESLRRCYNDIVLAHSGFTGSPVAGRYLVRHEAMLARSPRQTPDGAIFPLLPTPARTMR